MANNWRYSVLDVPPSFGIYGDDSTIIHRVIVKLASPLSLTLIRSCTLFASERFAFFFFSFVEKQATHARPVSNLSIHLYTLLKVFYKFHPVVSCRVSLDNKKANEEEGSRCH